MLQGGTSWRGTWRRGSLRRLIQLVFLLGAARALVPPRWWRQWPFLPLPDHRYWKFRMETAYGRTNARPSITQAVEVARWWREFRAVSR